MTADRGVFSHAKVSVLLLLALAAFAGKNAHAAPLGSTAQVASIQFAGTEDTPLGVTPAEAQRFQIRLWKELDVQIRKAAAAGAQLVLTPELSAVGYPADDFYTREDIAPYEDQIPGRATAHFGALAKELGIYIHVGLIEKAPEKSGNAFYNAVAALGPTGEIAARYRKINLFGGEYKYFQPGRELATYTAPFGKVALIICADVYNAYPMRAYRDQGIRIFAMGASWTVDRALESFSYYAKSNEIHLLAANTPYFPGSAIVRPDGSFQASIYRGQGTVYGTVSSKRKESW